MPPWLTLGAIKDGVIVIAILALGWWVYHAGENTVHVSDMKALQAQIAHMQQQQESWQREQTRASAVKQADLHAINSGRVVRPLHLRLCINRPAVETVLSAPSTAAAGTHPEARRSNVQAGQDIGPAVQAYQRWVERKFADCRQVLRSWPR